MARKIQASKLDVEPVKLVKQISELICFENKTHNQHSILAGIVFIDPSLTQFSERRNPAA